MIDVIYTNNGKATHYLALVVNWSWMACIEPELCRTTMLEF